MEKTVNSHLSIFADGMAALIAKWRAEMSDKEQFDIKSVAKGLKKFLQTAERYDIPAKLIVHTVLACEWVFRARRLTEKDIEKELYEMEAGFCKTEIPANPMLTQFQAYLLISALESELKKRIREQDLLIPLVFEPTAVGPHPRWAWFPSQRPTEPKRTPPKRLLRDKPGPLPMPGPRVAGVIVEAILEEKMKRGSHKMVADLCTLLLDREVQPGELAAWRKDISTLPAPQRDPPEDLRTWFKNQVWRKYDKTSLPSDMMPPEVFIERCEIYPENFFQWIRRDDVFKQIYSIKWGRVKNVPKSSSAKR